MPVPLSAPVSGSVSVPEPGAPVLLFFLGLNVRDAPRWKGKMHGVLHNLESQTARFVGVQNLLKIMCTQSPETKTEMHRGGRGGGGGHRLEF